MDQRISGELCGSTHGFNNDGTTLGQGYAEVPPLPSDPLSTKQESDSLFLSASVSSQSAWSSTMNPEGDSHEDFDFNDIVLKYISQMLMEEDMEEKACMFQESTVLQAAEKSLYELLGEECNPSPNYSLVPSVDQFHESPDENQTLKYTSYNYVESSTNSSNLNALGWKYEPVEYSTPQFASQSNSQSSISTSSGSIVDGFVDSPQSALRVLEIFSDSDSAMQFKRAFEEASKFIPNGNVLTVGSENNGLHKELNNVNVLTVGSENNGLHKELNNVVVTVEKNQGSEPCLDWTRGKKNPHPEDGDLEGGRSNKQPSVYTESPLRSEMFDRILLSCGQGEPTLHEALQNETSKNVQKNGQSKGAKARGKKQGGRKDVVDLRTLLTLCAQAVAANDRRNANDLLKQIRQHASASGDGMQRLAHYFANGLEARLAGSGTQIYNALITKPTSAADVLKAYHLLLSACPFRKLSNFFSNKTIMDVAEKATRLHIIDFGIMYGFQWPCLIERLSQRCNGPPKLRITGIDFPQPGFRPAERVAETGRRLSNYADSFNVPFQFNAIAQKWDTIQIDDLKLDSDEVLVVNCLYRLRNLLDETVVVESPRDAVLNLIRKMNPDIFIQGIVNGAYSAPFFITRFREAVFHFSTLFDVLETNVPRETPERMLVEKEIFGWEAMNVIACEGSERIERPETYKQWHVRNLRAGFKQLPLNKEIINTARDRVEKRYHKDFNIDEDCQWLLQGWKGRITYALSSWRPAW